MSKKSAKLDEPPVGGTVEPQESGEAAQPSVDHTEANSTAGGTVAAQEGGEDAQPSVDLIEGNGAVEVAVAPQELAIHVVYSAKYRVNYRFGVNLRAGPGREYPVIRVLPNDKVILAEDGAVEVGTTVWYPTGEGWVDSTYLIPVEEE